MPVGNSKEPQVKYFLKGTTGVVIEACVEYSSGVTWIIATNMHCMCTCVCVFSYQLRALELHFVLAPIPKIRNENSPYPPLGGHVYG